MLEQIMEDFKDYLVNIKKLNKTSFKLYLSDTNKFLTYMEVDSINSIKSINKTDLIQYLIELERLGRANSTISRNLSSLKTYFQFLLNKGYIDEDPSLNLSPPKIERKMPDILSLEEVESLLAQPKLDNLKGARDRAMLELLYSSGIMISELIDLSITDIDLDLGMIKVGQDNKRRTIPLGSYAIEAINLYLEFRKEINSEEDALFLNNMGNRISRQSFWKNLKEYEKNSNIGKKVTPLSLRQSFASHMLENGANVETVQKMLGHSNVATTQMYSYKKEDKNIREVYRNVHPRA